MRSVDGIPNRAWSYWAQGLEDADPIVQLCVKSWKSRGGFDRIDVVDSQNVFEFLPEGTLPATFGSLPFQLQSDFVRLALLREHGGFWMDASTLVASNVADWLELLEIGDGFFFFQNPGNGVGGRLFETGFLAARPRHQFVSDWFTALKALFLKKRVHRAHSPSSEAPYFSKRLFALLNKYLRRSSTLSALWASPPLSWLPFYPFFIVHYVGNAVLRRATHSHRMKGMQVVNARCYLSIRDISNKLGWSEALNSPLLKNSPVHDVEFRKPLSSDELLALNKFVEQ